MKKKRFLPLLQSVPSSRWVAHMSTHSRKDGLDQLICIKQARPVILWIERLRTADPQATAEVVAMHTDFIFPLPMSTADRCPAKVFRWPLKAHRAGGCVQPGKNISSPLEMSHSHPAGGYHAAGTVSIRMVSTLGPDGGSVVQFRPFH